MFHFTIGNNDGETLIRWHGQDLRGRKGGGPWHRRWWLNVPGNAFTFELMLFSRSCQFQAEITDPVVGDNTLLVSVALPFLFCFYVGVRRFPLLLKLPGAKWQNSPRHQGSGQRSIGFSWFEGSLWIYPWINRDDSVAGDPIRVNPVDWLLGREKYASSPLGIYDDVGITLPEGAYLARVTLFDCTWKRPRWPFLKRMVRAQIEVDGGVPVPGKGENDYDMGDDAIYSIMTPAATVEAALQAFAQAVHRDREKYANPGWVPDGGWPAHMIHLVREE